MHNAGLIGGSYAAMLHVAGVVVAFVVDTAVCLFSSDFMNGRLCEKEREAAREGVGEEDRQIEGGGGERREGKGSETERERGEWDRKTKRQKQISKLYDEDCDRQTKY